MKITHGNDIPAGMKLIVPGQMVGDGQGFYCYRDLYEDADGNRHSVRTSEWYERPRKV